MASLRVLSAFAGAGMLMAGGTVGLAYLRRRRWLSLREVVTDPAFAFPMVHHQGCLLPLDMYKACGEAAGMEFRHDDVIVASFPKSGTTWLQEIVFLLVTDLDFTSARGYVMEERVPYLEYVYPGVKELAKRESPRIMKTHLPAQLLPRSAVEKARILYIARDPRDVATSYFHFLRMFVPAGYSEEWPAFLHRFTESQLLPYAPWAAHVQGYRGHPAVLFLTYEELSKDPRAAVRRIADFLGKEVSAPAVERIVAHCSFSAMAANPAANYSWWDQLGLRRKDGAKFLRQGRAGAWQEGMAQGDARQIEALMTPELRDVFNKEP